MFLSRLGKSDKNHFIWLAHYVARADGQFQEKEELAIAMYCVEMGIADPGFKPGKKSLDDVLGKISPHAQKIVLLEIMALIYSDDFLAPEENEIISLMVNKFGLSGNLATLYKEWAKSAISLSIQGDTLLNL